MIDELLDTGLGYPQTNGIIELRENIAALYGHGATPDHVLVMVGAAEANFNSVQTVAGPGDEVVVMGRQGKEEITADEIARLTHTINYEVTAGLTGRIPLRHIK